MVGGGGAGEKVALVEVDRGGSHRMAGQNSHVMGPRVQGFRSCHWQILASIFWVLWRRLINEGATGWRVRENHVIQVLNLDDSNATRLTSGGFDHYPGLESRRHGAGLNVWGLGFRVEVLDLEDRVQD
jgi:hypothetical protein